MVQQHTSPKAFCKSCGKFLVTTFQVKCFTFRCGYAPELHNSHAPQVVQRRCMLPAEEAERRSRSTFLFIKVTDRNSIQLIIAYTKRLMRVLEFIDIRIQEKPIQFIPGIL